MNRSLSPTLLITIIGLLGGAALLWFFLQTGQQTKISSTGPGAKSRSAIGYAGIVDVLRQLGVPVEASTESTGIASGGGLVVIGEPNDDAIYADEGPLKQLLLAPKLLIVLPKWSGSTWTAWDSWIDTAYSRSFYDADKLLKRVSDTGDVRRVEKVDNWTVNLLGRRPVFKHEVQLIKDSSRILPIIAANEGILLGEIRQPGQTIWVLSDPDVISNHGLGERGEGNAILAVEMFKRLRGNESKIVFAESMHRLAAKPERPAIAMFQFPLYIVTAMGAMAIILLLWATYGRFGTALKPPPELASGKQGLVDNVARLMDYAGHHKVMIVRYVEATILDVGRQMHAPKGLVGAELAAWLTRLGRARGTSRECTQIFNDANKLIENKRSALSAFVAIARDVYRWKQEIIDGPSKHTRNN